MKIILDALSLAARHWPEVLDKRSVQEEIRDAIYEAIVRGAT